MARTPAQRGKIGNWLVERRMARSWATQEQARAEIERLTGWRIPQSVYAEWESGRRLPSESNLARLEEFYGAPASAVPTAGESEVAAEIRLLRAAVEAQTEAQTRSIASLGAALTAVFLQLGGQPGQSPDGSTVPRAGRAAGK